MITRGSIKDEIVYYYKYGGDISRIIVILILVFVVQIFLWLVGDVIFGGWGTKILDYFLLSSSATQTLKHIWTPFTYSLFHANPFHLIFNLLGLYWFGSVIKEYIGNPKITPIFYLGALFGGLTYLLLYNPIMRIPYSAELGVLIGASGGVLAILGAAATIAPNHSFHLIFFGPIRLLWIALFYVILDLFNIAKADIGTGLAHIGGLGFGVLFAKLLQNGVDVSKMFYAVIDFFTGIFSPKPKLKVVHKETKKAHSTSNTNTTPSQNEIDAILDKIGKSGYGSLTAEERETLFKASNKK